MLLELNLCDVGSHLSARFDSSDPSSYYGLLRQKLETNQATFGQTH